MTLIGDLLRAVLPGTDEAKARGCKCPKAVNHQAGVPGYGCSYDKAGTTAEWVVSTACRLHWVGYQFEVEEPGQPTLFDALAEV